MKKLLRSTSDKVVAGICGGLGTYFDIDSNLIRVLMVIFFIVTGFLGAIAYLVIWVIVPADETETRSGSKFVRSSSEKKIAGICGGLGNYFQIDPNILRVLLLIAFIFTGFVPIGLTYLIAWIFIPLESEPTVEMSH